MAGVAFRNGGRAVDRTYPRSKIQSVRRMKRLSLILIGLFIIAFPSAPLLFAQVPGGLELKPTVQQQPRTWTSVDGRKIEASLVGVAADHAILRMADGKEHLVSRSRLSAVDKAHLDEVARVAMKPLEKMLKQLDEDADAAYKAALVPPKEYRFAVTWDRTEDAGTTASDADVKGTGDPCAFRITNLCGKGLVSMTMICQYQVKLDAAKSKAPFAYPALMKPLFMMDQNKPLLFRTKPLAKLSTKLKPGEIVRDAGGVIQPDDIVGVMVKILHKFKVVHEWKSNPEVRDMVNVDEVIAEGIKEFNAANKPPQ